MKTSITQEQLAKSLDLLTHCAKNKWHFSIQEKIANMIAKAENKEEMLSKIEKIVQNNNEEQVRNLLDTL